MVESQLYPIIAVFVSRVTVPDPAAPENSVGNATVKYNCTWYWLVYGEAGDGHVLKDLASGDGQDENAGDCEAVLRGLNVSSQGTGYGPDVSQWLSGEIVADGTNQLFMVVYGRERRTMAGFRADQMLSALSAPSPQSPNETTYAPTVAPSTCVPAPEFLTHFNLDLRP